MSEIDKTIEHDPSKDSETTALVQDQEITNSENQTETQEVPANLEEGKGAELDGGQTEGVENTELDSENKAERNPTEEGDQASAKVKAVHLLLGQWQQVVATIKETHDVDMLKEALTVESESEKPRKSVVAALEERISLLNELEGKIDNLVNDLDQLDTKEEKNRFIDADPQLKKSAQRDKVAAEVFANNANCTKLFFTSDEIPFFIESDAIKHAFSLDDKTIIPKYKE